MSPNASKQQMAEAISTGKKRQRSESKNSNRNSPKDQQSLKNQRMASVEPFREKQPRSGKYPDNNIGQEITEPCKGKGKVKGKGKGKSVEEGKDKSTIDDIFAEVKRLKQAKVEEEAERCVYTQSLP